MLADLAVLIYFLHHIAVQIQLPQVIAGIAATCSRPSSCRSTTSEAAEDAELAGAVIANMDRARAAWSARRAAATCSTSSTRRWSRWRTRVDAVDPRPVPAGPLHRAGTAVRSRLAATAAGRSRARAGRRARDWPVPDPGPGCFVRRGPARGDLHPGAVSRGQRHLHGADLHRLDRRQPVQGDRPVAADQGLPGRQRRRPGDRHRDHLARGWSTAASRRSGRRAGACPQC